MRNRQISVLIVFSTVLVTAILITGCPSQPDGGGGAMVDAQLNQLENEIDGLTQSLQAAKNQDRAIGVMLARRLRLETVLRLFQI